MLVLPLYPFKGNASEGAFAKGGAPGGDKAVSRCALALFKIILI